MEMPIMWEEIHGFNSVGEYKRFVKHLEKLVEAKIVKEIDPDPNDGKGEIYGGRWFKNVETGQIWRLVPPDIPFKGLWELVET